MAIFGRRYQKPEDPGAHIRYMEEQLEFFARQVEKQLGDMETAFSAAKEEYREGLLEEGKRLDALEDRIGTLETETKKETEVLKEKTAELEREISRLKSRIANLER